MIPSIEITTVLPCSLACSYCPQGVLAEAYKGTACLTLEVFKQALSHVPLTVMVDFAGFAEPFQNPCCADMILHAHAMGYKVGVKSTLVGLSDTDAERIAHVPFGAFWYHDTGRSLKIPPFVTHIQKVEGAVRTSRAGNLYPEHRRDGVGVCRKSGDYKINVMLPNGDVVLCCNDYGLRHRLGNLMMTDYEALDRTDNYELCHFCPDWVAME